MTRPEKAVSHDVYQLRIRQKDIERRVAFIEKRLGIFRHITVLRKKEPEDGDS